MDQNEKNCYGHSGKKFKTRLRSLEEFLLNLVLIFENFITLHDSDNKLPKFVKKNYNSRILLY